MVEENSRESKNLYRICYKKAYMDYTRQIELREEIIGKTFELPKNLSKHEAFMVISYILDTNYDSRTIISPKVLYELENLMCSEPYGFKMQNDYLENDKVSDLYIYANFDPSLDYCNKHKIYTNWYVPNVTEEDIAIIYDSKAINTLVRKKEL